MKPTASQSQSRTRWGLAGTIGVHVALAALVFRQPIQDLIPRLPPHGSIEFRLWERPRIRQPEPPELSAPPRPLPQKRPPTPASAPPLGERLRRPPLVPRGHSDNEAPPEAPRQLVPLDLGKVDLLPKGVLRRLSEEDSGAGPNAAQRPDRDVSRQAATARLAQQRVQGFIESDWAKEKARSGFIDPVWRDLEASVHDLFKPPEALVRSGRSSMTLGERLGNQVSSRSTWSGATSTPRSFS